MPAVGRLWPSDDDDDGDGDDKNDDAEEEENIVRCLSPQTREKKFEQNMGKQLEDTVFQKCICQSPDVYVEKIMSKDIRLTCYIKTGNDPLKQWRVYLPDSTNSIVKAAHHVLPTPVLKNFLVHHRHYHTFYAGFQRSFTFVDFC